MKGELETTSARDLCSCFNGNGESGRSHRDHVRAGVRVRAGATDALASPGGAAAAREHAQRRRRALLPAVLRPHPGEQAAVRPARFSRRGEDPHQTGGRAQVKEQDEGNICLSLSFWCITENCQTRERFAGGCRTTSLLTQWTNNRSTHFLLQIANFFSN